MQKLLTLMKSLIQDLMDDTQAPAADTFPWAKDDGERRQQLVWQNFRIKDLFSWGGSFRILRDSEGSDVVLCPESRKKHTQTAIDWG